MLEAIGLLVVSFTIIALRGFILSQGWAWFIVPLGIVPIGIAWAIGISALVGMLTSNYTNKKQEFESFGEIAVVSIIRNLGVWFMMWVVTWFV